MPKASNHAKNCNCTSCHPWRHWFMGRPVEVHLGWTTWMIGVDWISVFRTVNIHLGPVCIAVKRKWKDE